MVKRDHFEFDTAYVCIFALKAENGHDSLCIWALYVVKKLPPGTHFIRFAKPGKIKNEMTAWEINRENTKTEKAKRWLHACGRQNFSLLEQITKDTYICSLHFIDPIEENPDPIIATSVTIGHFYDVTEFTIRKIFTTWLMFLFCHFKDYEELMFPVRDIFKKDAPSVFRKFKNIRCTEFFCEVPSDYARQGNTFSSYKHHCTMKCLIAITPNGGACFISDLFEGSISDVDIFEQSGILQYINPGDCIMVDKGFTVKELLLPYQATIFIPPFLGERKKFTQEELLLTKKKNCKSENPCGKVQ